MAQIGVRDAIRTIINTVSECTRLLSTESCSQQTKDYCVLRLTFIRRNFDRLQEVLEDSFYQSVSEKITQLLLMVSQLQVRNSEQADPVPRETIETGGRPKILINSDALNFFLSCGFSLVKIAKFLEVSVSTLKRRLKEFGIRNWRFSTISQTELDTLVTDVVRGNRMIGPNAVRARMFSSGIRVPRGQVRKTMLRLFPAEAALRALSPRITRRVFRVSCPNALWCADGNLKLVRYGFVFHGCVDARSRMIIYLHLSKNNRKDTVRKHFLNAVESFGVPSRIRVDRGGEYNDICRLMELVRGQERGSALRGRSVHNQRIERSWVDLWNGLSNFYYDIFSFLEVSGYYTPGDDIHEYALHSLYTSRIEDDLKLYIGQWNNHPMRTERNRSPLQIFVEDSWLLRRSGYTGVQSILREEPTVVAGRIDQALLAAGFEERVSQAARFQPTDVEAGEIVQIVRRYVNDRLGLDAYLEIVQLLVNRP